MNRKIKKIIYFFWLKITKHQINNGKRSILELINHPSEVPFELQEDYKETCRFTEDFLKWIKFSEMDLQRDTDYRNKYLLSSLNQDIIETVIGILINIRDGAHNPAKREARFLLELSIKMFYVENKANDKNLESKILEYRKVINSTNINIRNDIKSYFFEEKDFEELNSESGKFYGESSQFVHLTTNLIENRITKLEEGRTIGNETLLELQETNDFIRHVYALCIVYIMESLPEYIVNDWFSTTMVITDNWYYFRSKYISKIDETYDYKHERKQYLQELILVRNKLVKF